MFAQNHQNVKYFILLVSLCPVWSYSQTILSADVNIPKAGDIITMHKIISSDLGTDGTGNVWDLSKSKVLDEEITMDFLTSNDSTGRLIRLEPHSISQYSTEDDTLRLWGYEMPQAKVNFLKAVDEMRYPFAYGDSITGLMQGVGRYCERVPFRIYGEYKHKGDAIGTLILPEGDTISNVLCTCFEQVFVTDLMEEFCKLDTITPFSDETLTKKYLGATEHSNITIRKWYANGYRYPFLEAYYTGIRKEQPISSANALIYYCPLNGQKPMLADTETMTAKDIYGEVEDSISCIALPYTYDIYQTNNHQLHFMCQFSQKSDISYSVYTTDGVFLFRSGTVHCTEGGYEDYIDIPPTQKRLLVFDLHVNDKHLTEKIAIE